LDKIKIISFVVGLLLGIPLGYLAVSCSPPGTLLSTQPAKTPTIKTTGCRVRGPLPDALCTPGAIFLPAVTQKQVCTPGYAGSMRNVPTSEKAAVYKEYGVIYHATGAYEVDHLVSLELGGSNTIANLWPEAATPTPGYHQKDALEDYLHAQVCQGMLTLGCAQRVIAANWLVVYMEMVQKKAIAC